MGCHPRRRRRSGLCTPAGLMRPLLTTKLMVRGPPGRASLWTTHGSIAPKRVIQDIWPAITGRRSDVRMSRTVGSEYAQPLASLRE